jgi:hypothetical protein
MDLLFDEVYRLRIELEDVMAYFMEPPYNYPQEIVDEVIDIVDRLECLSMKLSNIDYTGSYRY